MPRRKTSTKKSSSQTTQKTSGKDGLLKRAAKNPVLYGATGVAVASGLVAVGTVLANKNMRSKVGRGVSQLSKAAGQYVEKASEYPQAVAHRVAPHKKGQSGATSRGRGKKRT